MELAMNMSMVDPESAVIIRLHIRMLRLHWRERRSIGAGISLFIWYKAL